MNYYIQGDAAKANQIKAAFEAKGYDISWPGGCANPDVINIGVERNGAKYVVAETSEYIKDIIKTHPDYKELELDLPAQSKFKVGDWIVRGEGFVYEPSLITEIRDYYICELLNGEMVTYTLNDVHKNFHLWTIQDAKDGDVLATDNGWTCIFKDLDLFNEMFSSYCFMATCLDFMPYSSECHTLDSRINGNIHPATKEQRDLLFAKMKEAGYEWNADKKELRKIQSHYDIANFHAGMPVMVRWYNTGRWRYSLYSFYEEDVISPFDTVKGSFTQCIPYNNDTKHLLGTTDMCDEQYINW